MIAAQFTAAVAAVCPIHGVSVGRSNDKATWRIDFKGEATQEQRAAAAEVLASFDAEKVLHNAAIDEQIADLEVASGGYMRGLREYMLGDTTVWNRVRSACQQTAALDPDNEDPTMRPVKAFAAALLAVIPDFMQTKGMQNVKALDDSIRTERAKRIP